MLASSSDIAWIMLPLQLSFGLLLCYEREREVSESAGTIAVAASTDVAASTRAW